MDLEPDLVAVVDGGGKAVELAVVHCVQLSHDIGSALGSDRSQLLAGGEVSVGLRLEEVVGFGFVAGAEKFAFVSGDASVEDAPVDVGPAAGFAGVEHAADAFRAPLGTVRFEHPVGVGERGGEGELWVGGRRC